MFKLKKSQVVVTDLFIALFIATILIVVIVFAWNRYTRILEEDTGYKEMQIIAFQTADLLVKSKGEPEDWEEDPDNVGVIGLASSDRYLSTEKVDAFINNISYRNSSKSLGISYYDFYFQINHINGTGLVQHGINYSTINKSIVNVQRLVNYKNEKAVMELALWK